MCCLHSLPTNHSLNNQRQHLNGDLSPGSHHDLLAGLPPTVGWKASNAPKCFGDQYWDDLSLDYTRQLTRRYRGRPLAAFGYAALPHSPDMSYTHHLDAPLSAALDEFLDTGLLSNSLLFLWSDHGLSYGSYFRSAAGKQEHRNPFLTIAVPKAFADRFPEYTRSLRANQPTPLTHFDLHATFLHVARLAQGRSAGTPEPPRPRRGSPHPKSCLSDQVGALPLRA